MKLHLKYSGEDVEVEPVLCPLCQQPMGYHPTDGSSHKAYFPPGVKASNLHRNADGTWRHAVCPELTGDCEQDCQEACAYPGRFSECDG